MRVGKFEAGKKRGEVCEKTEKAGSVCSQKRKPVAPAGGGMTGPDAGPPGPDRRTPDRRTLDRRGWTAGPPGPDRRTAGRRELVYKLDQKSVQLWIPRVRGGGRGSRK
jgi:hypothetical protein